MLFKGSATALVTPFTHTGDLDTQTMKNLINWQIDRGTQALVVLGTTGEASTLSLEERHAVMTLASATVNKRVPLIFGTGSNNTAEAINLTHMAQALGADAALVVTPYYNKSSQEGLYHHYKAIHDATHIPIILYNVPSRTGVNIEPATMARLKNLPRIKGIKQATNDLSELLEVAMLVDLDFQLFCGNDDMIYPFLTLGASGVISVVSNIVPDQVADLCHLHFSQQPLLSLSLQKKLKPLCDAMFMVTNPIPVKEALGLMGKIVPSLRLPLYPLSSSQRDHLLKVLLDYKLEVPHESAS